MDSICVSADYIIDTKRHISDVFPNIRYDGGFIAKFISHDESDNQPTFDIGDEVYVQCQTTNDIFEGKVIMPPTTKTKTYTIQPNDADLTINVLLENVFNKFNVPASRSPSILLQLLTPEWLKRDQ